MRLPRYQYTTSPSMGGAMRTPIRQADPTLERAGQRNVQNYLINPQAGQRDIGLETQAIASGMQVASALGKNLVALGNALSAADADAEYSRAWSSFTTWDSAQKIHYSPGNYDPTKPNPDAAISDIKELPTYADMVPGYKKSSKERIDLIVKDIKNKKARARFITAAANRQSQTLLTVSGWASNNHMEWLKGETLNCVYGSTTIDGVDSCLTGDNAELSHTPSQLIELSRTHKRRIANDAYSVKLIEYWNQDHKLDELAQRIAEGGIRETYHNEDGEVQSITIVKGELEENWEHLTEEDRLKRIDKIRQRQEQLRKEGVRGKDRARNQEIIKMLNFDGMDYSEDNIDQFAKDNPDFTPADINQMRTLLASLQAGPINSNLGELAHIYEDLEDWTPYRIAINSELNVADKRTLITARMALEQGGSVWQSRSNRYGSEGHQALQRLKSLYGVPEIGYFDQYMQGAIGKKQRENEQKYQEAWRDLQIYMSHEGKDPNTNAPWLDENKPRGAWNWVRQHEITESGKPTVVDPTAALEIWQEETGNDFTPSQVRQLPPGPIKDRLMYDMAQAGVDLGIEGVIDGKSLEQWIIDEEPGGPEAWMARLREMILGTDFHGVLKSGHPADGTPLSGSMSGITTRVPEVDVLDQSAPTAAETPQGGVGDFGDPISDELYGHLLRRKQARMQEEESKLKVEVIPITQPEPDSEPEPVPQAEWLSEIVENTDSSEATIDALGYSDIYLPWQTSIEIWEQKGVDVLNELRKLLESEDEDHDWAPATRLAIKLYTEGRYDK